MPTWHCTRKQASKTKQLDATTKASRIFINPEAATKTPGNVNITYDTQKNKENRLSPSTFIIHSFTYLNYATHSPGQKW
jgi:hypothetical protein